MIDGQLFSEEFIIGEYLLNRDDLKAGDMQFNYITDNPLNI